MQIKLENPKRFLPLLLYFGMLLVLLGSTLQAFTLDSNLAGYGWVVVAVSIVLWILFDRKK